jgi:hypothetical protein
METRIKRSAVGLAVALVFFGVILRLLPHPANFAPVGAIALFGGAILPRKIGIWLPLAVMVLSDLLLGAYHGIVFTWAAIFFVGLYGMSLRSMRNRWRIPIGALGSATIFFIVSNFGVWAQGQLYAHTFRGLIQCYTMALPFFRNTFLSDLLYGTLLFGAYALVLKLAAEPQQQTNIG